MKSFNISHWNLFRNSLDFLIFRAAGNLYIFTYIYCTAFWTWSSLPFQYFLSKLETWCSLALSLSLSLPLHLSHSLSSFALQLQKWNVLKSKKVKGQRDASRRRQPTFSQPSRNKATGCEPNNNNSNNTRHHKQQEEQLERDLKMHHRRNGECLVANGAAAASATTPVATATPKATAAATTATTTTAAGATAARCGCYFSLACSIGSMGLACGSLWQIPNTTDRITLQRGLFLTSLGFIYFVSLTDFCNKYLLETKRGQRFRQKYRLMISDVLEITNKWVHKFSQCMDIHTYEYIYTLVLLAPDLYLSLFLSLTRLCFLIEDAHSLIHSFIHSASAPPQRVKVKSDKWQVPTKK